MSGASSSSPRVLLVAKPWRGGLGDYLLQALREVLGADRVAYLPTRPQTLAARFRSKRDKQYWPQHLLQQIRRTPYDLAIFLYPLPLFAELGQPEKHACWLVDDAQISAPLAGAMGHVFLSDPGYLDNLTAAIGPATVAGVLPFAMLPSVHAPVTPVANPRGLCFVANSDAKRDQWLTPLLAAGMNCHTYGNYYPKHRLFWRYPRHFHGRVSNEGMAAIYARHRASLNLHAAVVREGTNMRSFEAAGYGIPQLVEHRPGLDRLLEPGKELLSFANLEELQEGYARLKGDPAFAQAMAQRAQQRVLAEHTYQHRVRQILARIA